MVIKDPILAYRRARTAFRLFNQARKARKERRAEIKERLAGVTDRAERRAIKREIKRESGMDTGLRTSTNSGLGGIVAYGLTILGNMVPALQPLLSQPEVVAGFVAVVMWLVARISRTKTDPGLL